MKNAIFATLFVLLSVTAFSQAKFGHTNIQDILMLLPERATAEKEVQDLAQTLESRLETMSKEYERKVSEYRAGQATMSQTVKESTVGEIQDLERRIQEFQQTAQVEIQNKQEALLTPMITKIEEAIKKVGQDNGFTYIFDTGNGTLLYSGGEDVTSLVKSQLGI